MKNLSSSSRRSAARVKNPDFVVSFPATSGLFPANEEGRSGLPISPLLNAQPAHAAVGAAAAAEHNERQIFEQALAEAQERFHEELSRIIAAERASVAQALRMFEQQRLAYFQRVEAEVVRLALSIARKILHREAQLDPLLLTGVVRVALENVASGTRLRLRVNPTQLSAWHDFLLQQNGQIPIPELIADAALDPQQCLLETELGVTEISLEAHLQEIEQGLFDLMAQRPGRSA